MALRGVRVVEFAGLAPGPFCGMLLSDFGARVVSIDKAAGADVDRLGRGKKAICLDLKNPVGNSIAKSICNRADVLIEPFRSGVMEKLGLGPDTLLKQNPRLIYARLTGFGQTGPMADLPGHDINFLALSGVLSMLGRHGEKPYAPINLLADFAGGGLLCAFGILAALVERQQSGKGQVIDASMHEGSAYLGIRDDAVYLASWLWRSQDLFVWGRERGLNALDGGAHFYDTYKTADGKYMAVGALEPQFYAELLAGLEEDHETLPQFSTDPHETWKEQRQRLQDIFERKSRKEWEDIFARRGACVTPVLSRGEAAHHPHNVHRDSYVRHSDGSSEPRPAPRLSRTPATVDYTIAQPRRGEHTVEVLRELNYADEEIRRFLEAGAAHAVQTFNSKL